MVEFILLSLIIILAAIIIIKEVLFLKERDLLIKKIMAKNYTEYGIVESMNKVEKNKNKKVKSLSDVKI